MVCIAAFIVLCLIGVFVAFLSIFRRDIGRKYWAVFKKSWYCVGKKVRLQKCDTNFKDDVKNSLLSRVVLKHPTWVKPLGNAIEVGAILIVFISIWSIVESAKAGLALWAFGTCNVSQPASCALGAEVCGIDAEEPKNPLEWTGRWFSEWGEIFGAIPDRLHSWAAEDYFVEPTVFAAEYHDGAPFALDIVDPGCTVCLQSYRAQKSSGFFESHNVALMLYPIELPGGGYKFANSDLIAKYFYAAALVDETYAAKIADRLFTETNDKNINYQVVFSGVSKNEAEKLLQSWLKDFKIKETDQKKIIELSTSEEVETVLAEVKNVVENQIHVKGIPTLIYDDKKHTGLYKND